jgi:hypothetical protein
MMRKIQLFLLHWPECLNSASSMKGKMIGYVAGRWTSDSFGDKAQMMIGAGKIYQAGVYLCPPDFQL